MGLTMLPPTCRAPSPAGEIVVLPGLGLRPTQLTAAQIAKDGRYDSQLGETSVQFNGIPTSVLYTWAGQLSAIVPYEITGPNAQVTVTIQGRSSEPVAVDLTPSAPGLFTLDSMGTGQAAAVNQDGSINTVLAPAPIGSIISMFATGEGQTSPPRSGRQTHQGPATCAEPSSDGNDWRGNLK